VNKQDRKQLSRDYWLARRNSPSLGRIFRARAKYIHISVRIISEIGKLPTVGGSEGNYINEPFKIEVGKNRFIIKGRNARKRGVTPA
jgi:hypothetical protein